MSDIMPGLSIVVPAHNSGPRLRETLQQLTRELGRDDVEVIIVENGSSDNTWEIAEELAVGASTVKTHVSALLDKFGVTNRVQLAVAVAECAEAAL